MGGKVAYRYAKYTMTKYLVTTSFTHIQDGMKLEVRKGDVAYCIRAKGYDYTIVYNGHILTISIDFIRQFMRPIK